MKHPLLILLFIPAAFAACLSAQAQAQRFHTRTYVEAEGLPNHVVTGVAQDARGRLWCVTPAGIATFDGTEWVNLPPIDKSPPEVWHQAVPSPDGSMWVVSSLVPARAARWKSGGWQERPPPVGGRGDEHIAAAISVRRGDHLELIVSARQGRTFGWTRGVWQETLLPGPVGALTAVGDTVYAAAAGGVFRLRDREFAFDRIDLPSPLAGRIYAVEQRAGGGLWVVGETWIARLDGTLRVLSVEDNLTFHFEPTIQDLIAQDDGMGGLYVGNASAVYRFEPGKGLHIFGRHSGLVTVGTTDMTLDAEGHVWVAARRGVTMIEDLSIANFDEAHGLHGDEVSVIAPLGGDRLLLGHINGVSILEPNGVVQQTIDIPRNKFSVRMLDYEIDRPGALWLAANSAGLFRYADGALAPQHQELTGGQLVTSVRKDGAGRLWILLQNELVRLDGPDGIDRYDTGVFAPDAGFFRKLFRDREGRILVAGSRGVLRVADNKLSLIARSPSLRAGNVFALLDEPGTGTLVGTAAGLAVIENGRIVMCKSPRIANPVYFLLRAPDRTLWIGTSNGVVRWDGHTAQPITVEQGLAGRETNRSAALVDSLGRVWIGTATGASRYDGRYAVRHRPPPRVELTSMDIDGESRPYRDDVALEYNRNNVAFHFRAITFSPTDRVWYRARLTGFDEKWSSPYRHSAGVAQYVNLPPGRYRFLVQAAIDSTWGPVITSPQLTIQNVWWRTPAFAFAWIGIALLLAAGAFMLLTQRRYARALRSEIERRTDELQRAERELSRRERLDALGVLAGGIAHDFNNLLTVILGNLGLIADAPRLDTQCREELSDAVSASKRAQGLASQLLTFSRGGAPVRETASIGEAIRESAGFVLRGSNVRAAVHIPESLWLVDIDTDQINQVLNNLLLNAVQAMPDGGEVEVTAVNVEGTPHTLPRGRYVRIRVRDEGGGIDPEHATRIFDPYFSTREGGTGLGLATAYSIIKRHDGILTVNSRPGEGAAFDIHLPASSSKAVREKEPAAEQATLPARVLVMDDEPAVRDVFGAMLRRIGCDVEFAKNGEEAVDRYASARRVGAPFDVVILDLTVPGAMGGRTAVERLREIDPLVRAIVSSGYSGDPVLSDPGAFGFAARIAKPFRPEDLSAALNAALAPCRRTAPSSKMS